MKLTRLGEVLKSFDGQEELKVRNETGEDVGLTYNHVLLNCLGSMKTENGKQAIDVYGLGVVLATKTGDIGISVEDLLLLRKAVEQNTPNYFTVVLGQTLSYLQSIDK